MIEYKGYRIQHERSYYRVTSLTDPEYTWTEDTVQEAKFTISYVTEEKLLNGRS